MNEEKEVFSFRRLWTCSLMAAGLIVWTIFHAIRFQFTFDRVLTILFLHCIIYPVLVLVLESERLKGHLQKNTVTCYRMLTRTFLGTIALYLVFSFMPAYAAAVMIPAFFLTIVSSPMIGIVIAVYLDLLLCMVSEGSYYELAAYLLLSICGCLFATLFENKKNRIYINILILAVSISIPGLFYYFGSYNMNYYLFLYGAIGGVISSFLFLILYDRITGLAVTEKVRTLQEIITPDYPLVKDIKNYSEIDYVHAVNVSKTAYQCAQQIGADAEIAAAAGFYYRLGKLAGDPFIENGVLLARQNCFPTEVIRILGEYNGEQSLPSSRESAIVHIVDAVIAKFEFLDRDTLSSTWNHDMVIYQTMNEKSATGIYDESGLSMNQYLQIREYLVKGVKLF